MVDLVSCLCITRDRPERLRVAVDQFLAQSYDSKELIIVVDPRGKHEEWLPEFELWLDDHPDVKIFFPPVGGKINIASLRNYSVLKSEGEILATWDDDDFYHPDRLKIQVERLKSLMQYSVSAVYMQNCGIYFEDTGSYHIVSSEPYGLAPSMVAWKIPAIHYQETEVHHNAGERSSDSQLQFELNQHSKIEFVSGQPWLYTRVFHGGNVWEREHFEMAVNHLGWYPQWLEPNLEKIRHGVKLAFPDRKPIEVTIREGKKYSLSV